ncbi:alpha-amylase family glycosyl hydrolase [Streptomyces acidicola]|uniref:alpha-amylase family glycosyl hydrolase n=1 Tax=Streptomyces acidicola TaxID=2596892 RepID=UPI00382B97B5
MGDDSDSFEIGGAAAHTTVRQIQKYTADQPELPGLLAEMHTVVDEYDDRMLMGELHLKLELVAALGARGLDIPMNFSLIDAPWNGLDLADLIRRYNAALPAGSHPNWVLSNHDRSRLASRIGPERVPGALTLLLTLRGTPTLYYGDELGLPDGPVDGKHARDCAELRAPGLGLGRDPQRMPMPWSETTAHAGFTSGSAEPWLPVASWAPSLSVERPGASPLSPRRWRSLGARGSESLRPPSERCLPRYQEHAMVVSLGHRRTGLPGQSGRPRTVRSATPHGRFSVGAPSRAAPAASGRCCPVAGVPIGPGIWPVGRRGGGWGASSVVVTRPPRFEGNVDGAARDDRSPCRRHGRGRGDHGVRAGRHGPARGDTAPCGQARVVGRGDGHPAGGTRDGGLGRR